MTHQRENGREPARPDALPALFGALAPNMEKYGNDNVKTSMRLVAGAIAPCDLPGWLGALARRDFLLRRWLTFLMRYLPIIMPMLWDEPPPHDTDLTREGQMRLIDSLQVSLIAPALGFPGLAVPVGKHERLRPGVQIVAGRFRKDLSLDAGEVIKAAGGGDGCRPEELTLSAIQKESTGERPASE